MTKESEQAENMKKAGEGGEAVVACSETVTKESEQAENMTKVGEGGEAVVACSDKSMKIGATMWDLETGEKLLHVPTCASPPFGFLCLKNRFLVASQFNKYGSVGGGAINVWSFNKPQQPLLNYTMEVIGPLSCTSDGIYLVGGALSGNIYLWDVTNGKLLKKWRAHSNNINCMLFSDDNSILISSSNDGMICVWSMISLLDIEETSSSPPPLHCWLGHKSSITGLLTAPCSYFSLLVSSSFDGTCKVWDFISGRLMQNLVYPVAITSISLRQIERLLFCGTEAGTIIVNNLDIGQEEGPPVDSLGQQPLELKGHNGAITALTSSLEGLISASEDGTICIWDIFNGKIIRKFNRKFNLEKEGKVTNLVVVPRSSLLNTSNQNQRKVSNEYNVSPLDKYPQQNNSFEGATTLLSLRQLPETNQSCTDFISAGLMAQKISNLQKTDASTTMNMQIKVETSIEHLVWATNMAKHVMAINKNLQSQLLGLMQRRLVCPNNINSQKSSGKKSKLRTVVQEEENKKD